MTNDLSIVLIGSKHTGKTVYLTALSNCPAITLNGSEVIEIIKNYWDSLKSGNTLPATSKTIMDLSMCYSSGQFNVNLETFDYDGHYAETLSEAETDRDKLRERVEGADGFILFLPADEKDQEAISALQTEIGTFINVIRDIYGESSRIPAQMVVAVNKWDKSQYFKLDTEDQSAIDYIKKDNTYNIIFEKLNNYFESVKVIPLSAYGHICDNDQPTAGKISPYRVEEPVSIIIETFFKNYNYKITKLRDENKVKELFLNLYLFQNIWGRCEGHKYDSWLAEAAEAYKHELLSELSKVTSINSFISIISDNLPKMLRQYLGSKDWAEIEAIGLKLRRTRNIRRIAAGFVAILILVIAILSVFNWNRIHDAELVLEDRAVPKELQIKRVNDYLDKYANTILTLGLNSDEIKEVLAVKNELLAETEDYEALYLKTKNIDKACLRATEAERLTNSLAPVASLFSPNLLSQYQELRQNSSEICSILTKAQSLTNQPNPNYDNAIELLKPYLIDPEVESLSSFLLSKWNDQLNLQRQEEIKIAESERIRQIISNGNSLIVDYSDINSRYNDIKTFLIEIRDENNDNIVELRQKLLNELPYRLYLELLQLKDNINNINELYSSFNKLKEFVNKENASEILSYDQKNALSNQLSKNIDKILYDSLSNIPLSVDSMDQINSITDNLNEIKKLYSSLSLDNDLFIYQPSEPIKTFIDTVTTNVNDLINTVNNGIDVNISLSFNNNNVLNISCTNFVGNQEIFFSGLNLNLSYKDPGIYCDQIGDDYKITFYRSHKITPFKGNINLLEENRLIVMDSDYKSCSDSIIISEDKILNLYIKGGELSIPLGNCNARLNLSYIR
ncbi:MAG: hypothetical protein LBR11_00065 [Deltaproteobacteria bacterium]|jgi:hypothetical protein|nr:hypothetical protein [Deltaproteobacteria bacterium]